MKVLFVANDPTVFIEGSQTRLRMRTYAEAIGELHILSYVRRKSAEQHDGALHLYPVTGSKILSFFGLYMKARSLVGRNQIQVVSAQDPFEYGWIALQASRGTAAKLHIQVHTDFLSPWFTKKKGFRAPSIPMPALNAFRVRIADMVLPHAKGVRVVSNRIAASLKERYGDRTAPISVIPVMTTLENAPLVAFPEHAFSFSLITVARLEPEKRVEDILYAIARIKHLYRSLGLFVVGDGRERKRLERLTKQLGLTEKVIFLGERPDARGLMKSAHAYIQASAYEGYGRTLLEAALARIPIITTDVGIVGEVFKGYEDVLAAPVADPAQLAVHITGLIEDHQARLALAINAEKKAREHLASLVDQPQRIAEDFACI